MNLKDLKGKYKGERIFIVGSGPSLKKTPLHLIKDEYSIAMNRIGLIFPETEWRPTFYMSVVREMRHGRLRDFKVGAEAAEIAFIADRAAYYYKDLSNVVVLQDHYFRDGTGKCFMAWSADPSAFLPVYGTTIWSVAQVVFYMGFDKIYLLGCDLGYKVHVKGEADPNHFITHQHAKSMYPDKIDGINERMHRAHIGIAIEAKKQGKEVWNATYGGCLEVHPRIDLLDVLNETAD